MRRILKEWRGTTMEKCLFWAGKAFHTVVRILFWKYSNENSLLVAPLPATTRDVENNTPSVLPTFRRVKIKHLLPRIANSFLRWTMYLEKQYFRDLFLLYIIWGSLKRRWFTGCRHIDSPKRSASVTTRLMLFIDIAKLLTGASFSYWNLVLPTVGPTPSIMHFCSCETLSAYFYLFQK